MKLTLISLLFFSALAQATTLELYRSVDQSLNNLSEINDRPGSCEDSPTFRDDLLQACATKLCGKATLNVRSKKHQNETFKKNLPPELAQDIAEVNDLVEKRVQEKIHAAKAEFETFKKLKDKTITQENGFEILQEVLSLSFTAKAEGQDDTATYSIVAQYDSSLKSPEVTEIINDLKRQALENLKQDPFARFKTGAVGLERAFADFKQHCQRIKDVPVENEGDKKTFKSLVDFCQDPSIEKMGPRKERELMQYWSKAIEFDRRISKVASKTELKCTDSCQKYLNQKLQDLPKLEQKMNELISSQTNSIKKLQRQCSDYLTKSYSAVHDQKNLAVVKKHIRELTTLPAFARYTEGLSPESLSELKRFLKEIPIQFPDYQKFKAKVRAELSSPIAPSMADRTVIKTALQLDAGRNLKELQQACPETLPFSDIYVKATSTTSIDNGGSGGSLGVFEEKGKIGQINLSAATCSHPHDGQSTVYHEFGHAVEYFFSDKIKAQGYKVSDHSAETFLNFRKCINQHNPATTKGKGHLFAPIPPQTEIDQQYTSEDFADYFSARITPGKHALDCELLDIRDNQYQGLKVDNDPEDTHSPVLLRVIRSHYLRSGKLPDVCQQLLKSHNIEAEKSFVGCGFKEN